MYGETRAAMLRQCNTIRVTGIYLRYGSAPSAFFIDFFASIFRLQRAWKRGTAFVMRRGIARSCISIY
ncbi:hypothetical protein KL86DPRO_20283 [uncultured delta proteobacterium]|uniref:Uncharacterized protein n=1 Tax=uncultured delta proteobacterium TaxID=34034 RepID=A0A212JXM8_9DELT|nr:hypothetical protein KL86DPRO_20283 [uncultured delta proteobacterium]